MNVPFDHLSRSELDWQLSPAGQQEMRSASSNGTRPRRRNSPRTRDPRPHSTSPTDPDRARGWTCTSQRAQPKPSVASSSSMAASGRKAQSRIGLPGPLPHRQQLGPRSGRLHVGPCGKPCRHRRRDGARCLHARTKGGRVRPRRHRIVLAGHSAGAHLAAAILTGMGGEDAARLPAKAVLISGVYDLAPIAASHVNDVVGLDAADVARLSTALRSTAQGSADSATDRLRGNGGVPGADQRSARPRGRSTYRISRSSPYRAGITSTSSTSCATPPPLRAGSSWSRAANQNEVRMAQRSGNAGRMIVVRR